MTPNETILATAERVRRRVFHHTLRNSGGYLSQACSAGELLATLYLRVVRLGPSVGPLIAPPFAGVPKPGRPGQWGGAYHGADEPGADRLVISPAHYALVVYAMLIELGRLDEDALDDFNADGSTVEMIGAEHSPGMEVTAGSLGQALSVALGRALARKLKGVGGRIVVLLSDGELQEGSTYEALQAATHYRLDNLLVYVDANGAQCDGPMPDVMGIEPAAARVRAFGWRVHDVDGHDPDALTAPALEPADGVPVMVIARTSPTHGIPTLAARDKHHYIRFKEGEPEGVARDLDVTLEKVAG